MSGFQVLNACALKWKLRFKLSTNPPQAVLGHINYVSYTPDRTTDDDAVDPGSSPRVTFSLFGGAQGKVFPFFGLPLSLTEVLNPIGELSQVLQYTVHSLNPTKPTPKLLFPATLSPPGPPTEQLVSPANDGKSSFGVIGIPDDTEVRIRSLNIFCTY